MSRMQPRTRWLAAAGILLVMAGLTARMVVGARHHLGVAAEARQRRDPSRQIRHLRRSMAYYLPGSPWVLRAKDELLAVAREATRRGDTATALDAYRQLRSAILGIRGITNPYAEELPEVNRAIVALSAGDPAAAPALRSPSGRAALLQRMARPEQPRPGWAAVGLAGFLLWSTGAFLLLFRGLGPHAGLVAARFWPLIGVVVAGQCLFWLGMAQA